MKARNAVSFLLLTLMLGACSPDPDMRMQSIPSKLEPGVAGGRIIVKRIGIFEDALAYHNRRGVYLIQDTVTGHEFIGISGVGISDLGNHYVPGAKGTSFHHQDNDNSDQP
jgi:hypothetical protein